MFPPHKPWHLCGERKKEPTLPWLEKTISRYHFVQRGPVNFGELPKPRAHMRMRSASPGEINTVKSKQASVNVLWQSDGMLAKPV